MEAEYCKQSVFWVESKDSGSPLSVHLFEWPFPVLLSVPLVLLCDADVLHVTNLASQCSGPVEPSAGVWRCPTSHGVRHFERG